MPTPGYYFRDGGATPPQEEDPNNEFRKRITTASTASLTTKQSAAATHGPLAQETSDSHKLATQAHQGPLGAVQRAGQENGFTNLGWQANAVGVDTLVGGIRNEELWTLIRRFNKVTISVKRERDPTNIVAANVSCQGHTRCTPGGLDLNIADEDEFSPDKLRSNIERLYMTVIIGMIGFGKHIARLRSWREPRRTAAFAGVYGIVWALNLVMPAIMATLIVLITVPQSRDIMFPPAPLALVDATTGGVQKPKAGVLGSHDSVTGAPEKYEGEAVEQEASNLVSGIASVAISSAAGRHDQSDPGEGDGAGAGLERAPDPTQMATSAADASASASGGNTGAHDKTKQPMEDAVWQKMRPAMHAIGDISDGWERFANALSPTRPFHSNNRLQLAAVVAPIFLVSLFVKGAWVVRGTEFITGFAFFTDPIMQRGIHYLNEKIPDWPKYLELRNSLLKGVPTNAQLTVTLLRVGEANRAPLPPPPKSNEPPPDRPAEIDKHAITRGGLDATHSDIEDAITVDQPSGADDVPVSPDSKKKKSGFGAKVMSAFKHTTAATVETKLTADSARAALGSGHAKQKLGILPSKAEMIEQPTEGPIEFKGRFKGKKGAVYVDSSVSPASERRPASPCVYFTSHLDGHEGVESMPHEPVWGVAISNIQELKKIGGLGWKGRIIVGWATDREIKDGLEITDKQGNVYRATALKEREELFNRLVAMGSQVWESY